MKDILKKRGIKIGIAVLAAVLVVLLSAHFLDGRSNFLENALDTVMQPLEKGAAKTIGWLEGIYGYMYKYDQLKSENSALKLRIAELEKQAGDYTSAIEENARLHELLGFWDNNRDLQLISASVTSWSSSNWSCAFTISKGSVDDVAVGDCIIDEYGNLVGLVTELSHSSATVRTLIDPSFDTGALIERSGAAAVAGGDFSLFTRGMLKMEHFADGAEILNGDTVITSGKGGVLPRGLIIGDVVSVENDASGLSQYAALRPSTELSSLSQVFIVTDYGTSGESQP